MRYDRLGEIAQVNRPPRWAIGIVFFFWIRLEVKHLKAVCRIVRCAAAMNPRRRWRRHDWLKRFVKGTSLSGHKCKTSSSEHIHLSRGGSAAPPGDVFRTWRRSVLNRAKDRSIHL